MDTFSVLISLTLFAVFDTVYGSPILAALYFLGLIHLTFRTILSLLSLLSSVVIPRIKL